MRVHEVALEENDGATSEEELSHDAEEESLEDSSDSDSDNLEEEDDEDEDPEDDSVDVTLEFYDPKEADFHGLKALLQSFLDGQTYACSELVDTIINQSTVGTVVKSGDHGDPVGVLSVLNTKRYEALQSLKEIKAYLLRHCKSDSTKASLESLWSEPDTGLMISERLINCPPQLAPPLQQALAEEVTWATEDEPTQELKDCYKFKHYIAFSRAFTDPSVALQPVPKKKQKKQKVEELVVYARPEDEFFHKHCTASYTFSSGRATGKDELEALRLVMLLTSEQMQAARSDLDKVVGNAAATETQN